MLEQKWKVSRKNYLYTGVHFNADLSDKKYVFMERNREIIKTSIRLKKQFATFYRK